MTCYNFFFSSSLKTSNEDEILKEQYKEKGWDLLKNNPKLRYLIDRKEERCYIPTFALALA